jgi:predicted component of type VI protein secretion system
MIVLTVVSCNGEPADGPSARFGEQGGSIGRADGNLLVLPDPGRAISRQHARIVCRAGRYAVLDNGSNPIAVNHQPRPLGQETPLWPGDLLQVGGYVLQVSQGSADAAPTAWNMGWATDATDAADAADAPAAAQAPVQAPVHAPDPLLDALLQGLAAPGLRIDALTPDHMRLLGQLLREATRGAVDLLADRAAARRHMRVAATVIQARDNNPLKCAPTTDAALLHLLGPAVAGFLPPAAAMRDAFDDLRAHQDGLTAGLQAAMAGMLQRFDPQLLETRLAGRGGLAGLIPANRKARLWDLFQQLYGALSDEVHQDGDQLFDEAFLRAYQARLDRLHADAPDWS